MSTSFSLTHSAVMLLENDFFVISALDNAGIYELNIKENVVYDDKVAKLTRKVLIELRPDHRFLLLVTSSGFFHVTRKARKLGAGSSFSAHLAAVAFYTDNVTLALMGELYNKINKPVVPTRVFTNLELAKDWLIQQQVKNVNDVLPAKD